jgi:hypothetical protein
MSSLNFLGSTTAMSPERGVGVKILKCVPDPHVVAVARHAVGDAPGALLRGLEGADDHPIANLLVSKHAHASTFPPQRAAARLALRARPHLP